MNKLSEVLKCVCIALGGVSLVLLFMAMTCPYEWIDYVMGTQCGVVGTCLISGALGAAIEKGVDIKPLLRWGFDLLLLVGMGWLIWRSQ